MALHATGLAEEKKRALFLLRRHRLLLAAREAIDRRVHESEAEFKFCDRLAYHREVDGLIGPQLGESREKARR